MAHHGPHARWGSARDGQGSPLPVAARSSFYGGIRPHSANWLSEYGKAADDGDAMDHHTSRFAQMRKANPVNVVLPVGRRWLESLPEEMRPFHLVEAFPRLVNLIALEWRDPPVAARVLTELLGDSRHGRRGFPPAVHAELHRLHFLAYLRLG